MIGQSQNITYRVLKSGGSKAQPNPYTQDSLIPVNIHQNESKVFEPPSPAPPNGRLLGTDNGKMINHPNK